MQPIIVDRLGTARFKANELVQWVAEPMALSHIIAFAERYVEQTELDQFLQLLGVTINHESLSQACRDEAIQVLTNRVFKSPSYQDGYDAGYEQAKRDILSALDAWRKGQ